jgi:hypothetical protein
LCLEVLPLSGGEGDEVFVAAVRAVEAEEAGGEVAAAEEIADGGEDAGSERIEGKPPFALPEIISPK